MLASVVLLAIQCLVSLLDVQSEHLCSHTSHTCSKYAVTDPDNPDYPGIPDGARQLAMCADDSLALSRPTAYPTHSETLSAGLLASSLDVVSPQQLGTKAGKQTPSSLAGLGPDDSHNRKSPAVALAGDAALCHPWGTTGTTRIFFAFL